jgi:hypothetical protein
VEAEPKKAETQQLVEELDQEIPIHESDHADPVSHSDEESHINSVLAKAE